MRNTQTAGLLDALYLSLLYAHFLTHRNLSVLYHLWCGNFIVCMQTKNKVRAHRVCIVYNTIQMYIQTRRSLQWKSIVRGLFNKYDVM